MSQKPTVVFFGTPDLAVYVLEELEAAHYLPALVVTAPDKPKGRSLAITPPEAKVWAEERGIPVLQPASLKQPEQVPELANSTWDLSIVAAYNTIMPAWLLTHPAHRTLNVHPSLLPRLRGPSPVRSALLTEDRSAVGVSIMELDTQVDHGPVAAQARVELPEWPVPARGLEELLFREGGRLLAEVIPLWIRGEITPEPQDDTQATHTRKFTKADGELDLTADGYTNYRTYCALDGWPGTYFFVEQRGVRTRVKVTRAAYHDGTFRILSVVPEGKREVSWEVWARDRGETKARE